MRSGDRRRRAGRLAAVAGAAALLASACGGSSSPGGGNAQKTSDQVSDSWDEVEVAAAEEGKVTLYTAQVLPILEALEAGFEQAHPDIDLEVVRGLPQDLLPKLEAERQTGQAIADVYVTADGAQAAEGDAAGHAATPVGPHFEADGYDAETNILDGGTFLSHAVVFGWGWNTDDVPDGLDGYEALLDPSLSGGKIAVIEPANQALTDFWLYLEENLGEDFVEALAAQQPRIYPGGGPIQEALTSGEVQAALYAGAAIEDGKAAGAPIEWEIPENPWGARYWTSVVDIAPHPNAAQVLADYLVSPEGQEIVAKGNASTLPDVPGTLVELSSVPAQDTEKLTPEFVQQFLQDWKSRFQ